MLLYISPVAAEQQMANATPEQMEAGMKPWMDWFGKLGPAVIDGGQPLGSGTALAQGGAAMESTKVAGYSVIEAPDLAAAKSMVDGHPHYMVPGAAIEIHEIMQMPGM